MLSDRCLSALLCLWRWCIVAKRLDGSRVMKLGKEIGLGPGHIVLDEHPAALPKGAQPQFFDPCLFWPNDRMDQMATWYGGRPRPRPHCVKWGFSSLYKRATAPPIFGDQLPLPKGHSPQFSAHVYCGQTIARLSYCWALVKHPRLLGSKNWIGEVLTTRHRQSTSTHLHEYKYSLTFRVRRYVVSNETRAPIANPPNSAN